MDGDTGMLTYFLAVVAALLIGTPVRPSDSGLERADSLVTAWVDAETVSGAVLLVSRHGEIILEKAYGWASLYAYEAGQYPDDAPWDPFPPLSRLDEPVQMTTSTRFDLASVTKVMATTFAVMLLVDEGTLDLGAPVQSYLTDFRDGGRDQITLTHLLTHRAGLSQWEPTYYHAANRDEAYRFIRDLPLKWEVGEGRHYSDLGFMLLGRIVEEVTGQSLDGYLQARLYGPLGLTATGFRPGTGPFAATSHGNPFELRMVHDPDFGYRIEGDATSWDGWRHYTLRGEVNDGNAHHAFGGMAGHAGLFSTARELQVLLQLLLDEGSYDGTEVLTSETVTTFLTSTGDGQALSWQSPDYAPEGSFAHTGFTGTWVLGVPKDDLAVILLTNRQNGGVDASTSYPDVGPLQRAVAAALLGGG